MLHPYSNTPFPWILNKIPIIGIEGGPGGGKDGMLVPLKDALRKAGYRPFVASEAATILFLDGMRGEKLVATGELDMDPGGYQRFVVRHGMHAEDLRILMAMECLHQKPAIVTNRTLLDGEGYVGVDPFKKILRQIGLNRTMLLSRYTGIIHMVTSADGAEAAYLAALANNPARDETPDVAREVDKKTIFSCIDHPRFHIIGNDVATFEEKVARAIAAIMRMLGVPSEVQHERKFLIQADAPDALRAALVSYGGRSSIIKQRYLKSDDGVMPRIRSHAFGPEDDRLYSWTLKTPAAPAGRSGAAATTLVRTIQERRLTEAEYRAHAEYIAPGTHEVVKERWCFRQGNSRYVLDIFEQPTGTFGTAILECRDIDPTADPVIPDFLTVLKEVTLDPAFSNEGIASNARR